MSRWVPLESNPEVMNEFLTKMGVPASWTLSDVFGLNEDMLAFVPQPAIALILLFPLTEKAEEFRKAQEAKISSSDQEVSPNVYFLKQYISNACGSVALIHAVGNNMNKFELEDGPLKNFIDSTKDKTPEERGHALESDDGIADVHETIAKQGQTNAPERDTKLDTHFIVFVHVDGKLYELDGRKEFPINHGETDDCSFLGDAAKVCQTFIDADKEENRFAIMALANAE